MKERPISHSEEASEDATILPFRKPEAPTRPDTTAPEGPYWLRNLPEHTEFLYRNKTHASQPRQVAASRCHVVKHLSLTTCLCEVTSQVYFWVVTNDFSLQADFLELVPIFIPPQENQENADSTGHSNSTGLVGDAPVVEGVDPRGEPA